MPSQIPLNRCYRQPKETTMVQRLALCIIFMTMCVSQVSLAGGGSSNCGSPGYLVNRGDKYDIRGCVYNASDTLHVVATGEVKANPGARVKLPGCNESSCDVYAKTPQNDCSDGSGSRWENQCGTRDYTCDAYETGGTKLYGGVIVNDLDIECDTF